MKAALLKQAEATHAATLSPDVLARMSPEDAVDLRAMAHTTHFSRNELIFHAGAPGRNVYFLQKGRVKIYQPSLNGKEVILWFCFPGDMFGLAEVAQGGGRIVNAVACEKSEVLTVSQNQFADFMQGHPAAALLVMQVLSCRLRTLGEVIVNLVNDDVRTRIMKLVLRLSARQGQPQGQHIHLDLPLTHQEIADMVGTTRQTVTSVLSELKRQGLMSLENRRIQIESTELLNA